jgi:cobalt-zinc-cadmium efflux system membrane fusion protein
MSAIVSSSSQHKAGIAGSGVFCMKHRLTRSAVTALMLAATGLLGACQHDAESEPPEPKVNGETVQLPVNQAAGLTLTPVSDASKRTLLIPGRVVWNEDKTVRIYTPFSGHITHIDADIGSSVVAGQALAMITSPDFGQAQADYHKAAADMSVAQKNLERQKGLFEHGITAAKDLEQAQADYDRALAEHERVDSLMKVFGKPVNSVDQQFALKSPIAGVVVERTLNPGQLLRADQPVSPMFVVTDPTDLWVQLDAGESDLVALKDGKDIALSSSLYPDELFKARVSRVADFVDPVTRTVKVRALVSDAARKLRGEMYVTAHVEVDAPAMPAVPATAVYLNDSKSYVFVVTGPDSYTRRLVQTRSNAGGDVLISQGLKAGERVVSQGALYLQQILSGTTG